MTLHQLSSSSMVVFANEGMKKLTEWMNMGSRELRVKPAVPKKGLAWDRNIDFQGDGMGISFELVEILYD